MSIDYDAVLKDLRERRAALDRAIDAILPFVLSTSPAEPQKPILQGHARHGVTVSDIDMNEKSDFWRPLIGTDGYAIEEDAEHVTLDLPGQPVPITGVLRARLNYHGRLMLPADV